MGSEARDRDNVFDVGLLAGRLADAISWIDLQPELAKLSLGVFGASTGAAAALRAAADVGDKVMAVVSRGGRPDLAGPSLAQVRAPTLLIVGGDDDVVLELNQRALTQLTCHKGIRVIPGATHLFPEPGALERVIGYAQDWFDLHLARQAP